MCPHLCELTDTRTYAVVQINVNFFLPFWRDVLLALGLVDASFKSLSAALERGRSVAIVLGGAAEVSLLVCLSGRTSVPVRAAKCLSSVCDCVSPGA